MTTNHFCPDCLSFMESDACPDCSSAPVDLSDDDARQELLQSLRTHEHHRRKRLTLALQIACAFFCFGLLYVGLTIAEGLQSPLVSWSARLGAIALLAACFYAIPRIYVRQLVGPHGQALRAINPPADADTSPPSDLQS